MPRKSNVVGFICHRVQIKMEITIWPVFIPFGQIDLIQYVLVIARFGVKYE